MEEKIVEIQVADIFDLPKEVGIKVISNILKHVARLQEENSELKDTLAKLSAANTVTTVETV